MCSLTFCVNALANTKATHTQTPMTPPPSSNQPNLAHNRRDQARRGGRSMEGGARDETREAGTAERTARRVMLTRFGQLPCTASGVRQIPHEPDTWTNVWSDPLP